jgi:hypothetical protein
MTAGNGGKAAGLARRLRELREHQWPEANLTQAQLASALSAEGNVAHTTISSWESHTNPKAPPRTRLKSYARFFATQRSLLGKPHLVAVDQLTDDERQRAKALEEELLALYPAHHDHDTVVRTRRALLAFEDTGPIVVICPEAPEDARGPLADEDDVNYTKLHKYADLDALIEIFGHIRALNPERHVLHRLPSDVQQAELQNHLVLLGGIGWNSTTRRILLQLDKLPIEQVEADELKTGEVFRIKKDEGREEETYFPVMEETEGRRELVEDLALLARLPNPFNFGRTLTICNGVHSSGVLGAVMILTDETLRPGNEEYLARRFPEGAFAMLVKVPVVSGKVLAPDLQNPDMRLFEWAPEPVPTGE